MKEQWFKGKKDAPEGTIPGIGKSGPGALVRGRSADHIKALKDTGYYEPTEAPKPLKPPVEEPAQQTLAPDPAPEAREKEGK